MTRPAPISKATRASELAEILRGQILRGEMTPGSKVNLSGLRDSLGVSLSPLREAIARLAAQGLVDAEDQRGVRIAPVSLPDLAEITLLRAEAEVLALRFSVARGGLDWESEILGARHRLARSDATGGEAYAAFHAALAAGCALPRLIAQCAGLVALHQRYGRICGVGPTTDGHADLAAAALSRNLATASALLRAHVEATGAALAAALSTPSKDITP